MGGGGGSYKYSLEWKFQKGGASKAKVFSVRGMDIFGELHNMNKSQNVRVFSTFSPPYTAPLSTVRPLANRNDRFPTPSIYSN